MSPVPLPVHYSSGCPDCPGARLGTLEELVGGTKDTCAFDTCVVEAKEYVPLSWGKRYGFGLVRRGVLIRQRVGVKGRAIAIDAAGPGCVFPISAGSDARSNTSCGYAATDLIVCLCRKPAMEAALNESHEVGRDLLELQRSALDRVERIAQARGAPTVREKVALLLGALADTLSPPRRRERLPSALQQRDLSRLVGVRHESFCRVLGELEKSGAIQREPDGLRIVDRERLDEA